MVNTHVWNGFTNSVMNAIKPICHARQKCESVIYRSRRVLTKEIAGLTIPNAITTIARFLCRTRAYARRPENTGGTKHPPSIRSVRGDEGDRAPAANASKMMHMSISVRTTTEHLQYQSSEGAGLSTAGRFRTSVRQRSLCRQRMQRTMIVACTPHQFCS